MVSGTPPRKGNYIRRCHRCNAIYPTPHKWSKVCIACNRKMVKCRCACHELPVIDEQEHEDNSITRFCPITGEPTEVVFK